MSANVLTKTPKFREKKRKEKRKKAEVMQEKRKEKRKTVEKKKSGRDVSDKPVPTNITCVSDGLVCFHLIMTERVKTHQSL